jgi:Fe-Mn family superoxide dismutase
MAFVLPDLDYSYEALEPVIKADLMKLHHSGHHAAYVKNLNLALEKYPELQKKTIEELLVSPDQLPEEIRTAVKNNGGGHYNHSLFWKMINPKKSAPNTQLLKTIEKTFTSFETFKDQFSQSAAKVFGSGWQWLVLEKGELKLVSTQNQDTPISRGQIPLLTLDVWEHAYYLQYLNKRVDYISAWWNVINWEFVSSQFSLQGE